MPLLNSAPPSFFHAAWEVSIARFTAGATSIVVGSGIPVGGPDGPVVGPGIIVVGPGATCADTAKGSRKQKIRLRRETYDFMKE